MNAALAAYVCRCQSGSVRRAAHIGRLSGSRSLCVRRCLYVERGEARPAAPARTDDTGRTPALFRPRDVIALELDTRMLLADRVEPELLEPLRVRSELSADARQALTILTSWDDKASRAAVAPCCLHASRSYSAFTRQPFAIPWDRDRPAVTPGGLADPDAAPEHRPNPAGGLLDGADNRFLRGVAGKRQR